jgi:hypothetical protein
MYSRLALSRTDNYDLKKKVQLSGGFIIMSGKKRLSHLAVSGNVPVKKTYSRLAIGRNDNYDMKKKDTDVWRVHNYV